MTVAPPPRTLPTPMLARAFHPMFALYAGVLAGAALIFDLLYLMVGGGVLMAALYTLPVTAGLVACLVAAADELRLDRTAVRAAVLLAGGAGLTNALYLGAIGSMRATDPSNWAMGAASVVLSCVAVLSAALTLQQTRRVVALATPAPPTVPTDPLAPALTWTASVAPATRPAYVERVNPGLAALVNQTLVDQPAAEQTLVDPVGQTLVLTADRPAAA
ncbi:hypothetical protein BWI15_28625 [Kribbella sp. ALI-6-A]|uniref:hypothetical protein n=1 Tax=Kribbella sp. ALI-6-A TaxID=1933817 RepID=UPI00097C46C2|nr:hypothetical protein [Kribbella sp. ALI-6-A]ONI67132.1 hypothetical protein BWI15_28625 [Kribbella sp. ALI-6-A]